jgi:hypothetical protein
MDEKLFMDEIDHYMQFHIRWMQFEFIDETDIG